MLPDFTNTGILPPVAPGADVTSRSRSPYPATLQEFIQRFATNRRRAKVLKGFLQLRSRLLDFEFQGLQWVDGSFVENKDRPNDVDVVTLFTDTSATADDLEEYPEVFRPIEAGARYHVDHYLVQITASIPTVRNITYWYSLFSHQRDTRRWKGMVQLPLEGDGSRELELVRQLREDFDLDDGENQ